MHQFLDRSKPAPLPRAVRIFPRRRSLRTGLAAGVALTAVFVWFAGHARGELPRPLAWIAIGLSALVAIGSAVRLLLQLPIIEASELGIAIWFHGPYRRPFFAPWNRVRAIVLTRVRTVDHATGAALRDALGIELIQDHRFQSTPGVLERRDSGGRCAARRPGVVASARQWQPAPLGRAAATDEVGLCRAGRVTRPKQRTRFRALPGARINRGSPAGCPVRTSPNYFGENGCLTDPFFAVTSAAVGVPATARSIDSFVAR